MHIGYCDIMDHENRRLEELEARVFEIENVLDKIDAWMNYFDDCNYRTVGKIELIRAEINKEIRPKPSESNE